MMIFALTTPLNMSWLRTSKAIAYAKANAMELQWLQEMLLFFEQRGEEEAGLGVERRMKRCSDCNYARLLSGKQEHSPDCRLYNIVPGRGADDGWERLRLETAWRAVEQYMTVLPADSLSREAPWLLPSAESEDRE